MKVVWPEVSLGRGGRGIGWDRSLRTEEGTTQSGQDHGARDRRQDDGGDNAEDEECLEKAAVMVRRAMCTSLLCLFGYNLLT